MEIENTKNWSLDSIKRRLEIKCPDYKYQKINDTILVTKEGDIKLNVFLDEEVIKVVEAVPFVTKMAVALGFMGLIFYILSTTELSTWVKVVGYVFSFLIGGILGDLFHKYRFQKQYSDFKPVVIAALQN